MPRRHRSDDTHEIDVLEVADLRSNGRTSARVAEEVEVLAAAGYRVGLVHLQGATEKASALATAIRRCVSADQAELLLPYTRARASVVVVHDPAALQHSEAELSRIETDRVIVVASGNPDSADHYDRYTGDGVRNAVARLFNAEPSWVEPDAWSPRPGSGEAGTAALTALIGPPARAWPGGTSPSRSVASSDGERVLMVTSNGAGMGHLTRLLAYAGRAHQRIRPYFLSLSEAVPLTSHFGHPYEYVPSVAPTGFTPGRWHAYLRNRISEAIRRLQPAVVVFDGSWVYEGLMETRVDHPHVPWVWSRRGMWYRGMNRDQLAKAAWFDLVVEPGDFAAGADRGVTARAPATRVGPVTLLNRCDLDDRDAARRALGLDPDAPTALVTLGAGNINDATSATRVVIDVLGSVGLQVCVTQPEIAERTGMGAADVHVVSEFPLSRRYAAFDLAVSAAGYNSFHELLRFGVPTLFLPNLHTSLDDQESRARYAADQGWAHAVEQPEPSVVRTLLTDLMDNGRAMVAGVAEIDPGNGAAAAMAAVEKCVKESR